MSADRLSPGQLRVLELVADGLPDKEVAHRLGIAKGTVHNMLVDAYRRLGVDNRMDACVAAGLLRRDGPSGRCGHIMACSRLAGHRGRHNGFRELEPAAAAGPATGPSVVVPLPVRDVSAVRR